MEKRGKGRKGREGAMRRKGIRKRDREGGGGQIKRVQHARFGDRRKYRCKVRRGFVDKLYTQIETFQRLMCLSNLKIVISGSD